MSRFEPPESRPERSRDDARARSAASSPNRRRFLGLLGTAGLGAGLGGAAAGTVSNRTDPEADSGPPSADGEWSLTLDDAFEGSTLADTNWNLGWGWGKKSSYAGSDHTTRVSSENVDLDDGRLRLVGTHDGDEIRTGCVNTRGSLEFGPGTYFEAEINFAEREGFHSAFWAKPPGRHMEINAVEYLHSGTERDDTHVSEHFIHYTVPGTDPIHDHYETEHELPDSVTENFHVYGAEWRSDRIIYYVDGEEVQTWTDGEMLRAMAESAPFYLMVTLNVNVDSDFNYSLGQADLSEPWGERTLIDRVRVWQL